MKVPSVVCRALILGGRNRSCWPMRYRPHRFKFVLSYEVLLCRVRVHCSIVNQAALNAVFIAHLEEPALAARLSLSLPGNPVLPSESYVLGKAAVRISALVVVAAGTQAVRAFAALV